MFNNVSHSSIRNHPDPVSLFNRLGGYFLLVWLALGNGPVATSHAESGNIILVTDRADLEVGPDSLAGYLSSLGYNVTVSASPGNASEFRTLDAAKINRLQTNDLVILDRPTDSGSFDELPEPQQWNNLNVPLLLASPFLARLTRWNWVSSAQGAGNVTDLNIVAPTHPIVSGLGSNMFAIARNLDRLDAATAGNGTLVATVPGSGTAIAVWDDPGGTPTFFFGTSGETYIRRRVYFGLHNYHEVPNTNPTQMAPAGGPSYWPDISPNGKELFSRAVAYAMNGTIGPLPPRISNLSPANGALFVSTTNGISFNATAADPIPTEGITLFLNGSNVTSSLVLGSDPTNRTVNFNGVLSENAFYTAVIIVTNTIGSTTNNLSFDTFSTNLLVIEAEDYNFGDAVCALDGTVTPGSGTGGQFHENPVPSTLDTGTGTYYNQTNGYVDRLGELGIDFFDATATPVAGNNAYRFCEPVGTRIASDSIRPKYRAASAAAGITIPDHQVDLMQPGEWLNYTRTISNGVYNVYLRAAGGASQQVRLDRVGGDRTTTSQTTTPIGSFIIPAGGYRYVPLADTAGNPIAVSFSGLTTLRLNSLTANNNLTLNFLVFVPAASTIVPPYVAAFAPGVNATGVSPTTNVTATLVDGTSPVNFSSIRVFFDSVDVTSSAAITDTAQGAAVSYDPPGNLASNSLHAVQLIFSDSNATPTSFTNSWSFTVLSYATIPMACGTPAGSGTGPGFNIKIRKLRNDATGIAGNLARTEQHLADQLIDPLTSQPYVNEAAGPNGDGRFAEPDYVNYQQTAAAAGYFTSATGQSDETFPYVDPSLPGNTNDPNYISMEAVAYLELPAGFYRFGVRSDDGFKLTAGPVANDTNLVLGFFDAGRGDALPGGATEFDFFVETSGVYAFRLIWWEGTVGASLEFYSVDVASGTRTLINDPNITASIKGYLARTVQLFVPTVTITSPTNNTAYASGPTNIPVTADASVTNGRIARVEFFAGAFLSGATNKIGEATSSPFSITWTNVDPGHYVLIARATDTNAFVAVSAPVKISVGQPLVSINFQTATAIIPSGYLPDFGDVFGDRGNGYNYGWDLDNTAFARDRNSANSPDERYDTLNHMQRALPAARFWDIVLPNGQYKVEAVMGDPDNQDSVYDLQTEGVTIVYGVPTATTRFFEGIGNITVSDGQLTIGSGPLANNNKICFVDIFQLSAASVQPMMSITYQGTNVVISWTPTTGALESADVVTGPYNPVTPSPLNPATIPIAPGNKFFRIKQ